MFGTILLTFIITVLSMAVLILLNELREQSHTSSSIRRENEKLRTQINEYNSDDQRRRERSAYDRGLYDGRGTDALYRQCLKKYMAQDQSSVMLNGEKGE